MPYFRLYNPCPDGKSSLNVEAKNAEFVRYWVPELKDYPSKYIIEPHLAPTPIQENARCIIGKDYPHAIVDHNEAVSLAKSKIAEIRKGANFKTIAKKVYVKHGSRNSNRDVNFVDSNLKKMRVYCPPVRLLKTKKRGFINSSHCK